MKVNFAEEKRFGKKEETFFRNVNLEGCLTWTDQIGRFDASLA